MTHRTRLSGPAVAGCATFNQSAGPGLPLDVALLGTEPEQVSAKDAPLEEALLTGNILELFRLC